MPDRRALAMVTDVRRRLLPDGNRTRALPLGIARGLRMNIDFGRGQTRLYFGLYETELNGHLRRLCRRGFCSFDVGAQFGYDSLVVAKLTGARVIAVECDAELVEETKANVAANPEIEHLIEVRQAFIDSETDPSRNRLSLDELAEETFVPDFVKMDIEGGEAAALDGFRSVLLSRRPNLIVEVHSGALEEQCLDTLRASGYTPLIVNQRRWFGDYRPSEHNRWIVAETF